MSKDGNMSPTKEYMDYKAGKTDITPEKEFQRVTVGYFKHTKQEQPHKPPQKINKKQTTNLHYIQIDLLIYTIQK